MAAINIPSRNINRSHMESSKCWAVRDRPSRMNGRRPVPNHRQCVVTMLHPRSVVASCHYGTGMYHCQHELSAVWNRSASYLAYVPICPWDRLCLLCLVAITFIETNRRFPLVIHCLSGSGLMTIHGTIINTSLHRRSVYLLTKVTSNISCTQLKIN